MRVIIAGSRQIHPSPQAMERVTNLFTSMYGATISAVLSGNSGGCDLAGERWAESHGIALEKYPADWNKHGKRAGPMRNKKMVSKADAAIAIWDGTSRGTHDLITTAEARGLPVLQLKVGGDPEAAIELLEKLQ